jgi:hypothetical protein
MIRTLALLSLLPLLLGSTAAAQEKAQSQPAAAEYYHYQLMGKARWEGEIVTRTDITLNDDLPSKYEFCMVPPGADWALESKDPAVEDKYLTLLERVVTSDGIMGGDGDGSGGGWIGACGEVKRYHQIADFQRMDNVFIANCRNDMRVDKPHKYASKNRMITPAGFVAVDSLKALLQSDHPKTVIRALAIIRELKRSDKIFGPLIGKLVLDEKQPEEVRIKAAEALATLVPDQLSGKTIASLWTGDTMSEKARIAAMNDFAFLLHYGDAHGGGVSQALEPYLKPLLGINNAHRDENTLKADKIGEAAYCAAMAYPEPMRKKALGR